VAGKKSIMRSFIICTPHQYYLYEQTEVDKMVRACGTYGKETNAKGFFGGNIMERNHLEGLSRNRKIILKWI